jgi:hypothetical protein
VLTALALGIPALLGEGLHLERPARQRSVDLNGDSAGEGAE